MEGTAPINNLRKNFFMHTYLDELNEVQKQAVLSEAGPMLILAGAGSGKTRTLTYRIAHLIHSGMAKPAQILAVTFTNKAAREMRDRIETVLGSSSLPLWIGTFHSICARILRVESEFLGFTNNFSIYDVDDSVRALKKVLSGFGLPQQQYSPKMIQNKLSRIKNQFLYPENLDTSDSDPLSELMPEIYKAYQDYLRENNAFDFDDLLMKPIELFHRHPEVQQKYSKKFQQVLVDEYQDTNKAQYLLIKRLVQDHKNICVVGDEDQSIYGWRGADIHNILNFNKDFPEARTYKLEQNYRSKSHILEAAHSVVKHNKERIGKKLWTERDGSDKIKLYAAADDKSEAKHLVEIIHEEMYTNKRSFKDIAVLYRTNAQSRVLEDALRRNAISYNIVGGVKFFERKEIKDILAYLKLIVNPADSISLKRIVNFPLRGIGDTTVSKIEKFADMEGITLFLAMGRVEEIASISPAMSARVTDFYNLINKFIGLCTEMGAVELVSTLASDTGILHHYQTEYDQYESESRVANIQELFSSIEQFTEERKKEKRDYSLASYIEEVSLMTDVDTWNATSNAVTLMTLHAAKGLEFPVVCITGLEMGLMPLQRTSADLNELEEERRLLYVGMTRAEDSLYLSYALSRRRYKSPSQTMPSLFLDEIPQQLLELESESSAVPMTRSVRRSSRRKKIESYFDVNQDQDADGMNFKIGQPVYHETFGKGRIIGLEGTGDKMKITVHFQDEDIIKKLIKQYANLSPIEN